MLFTLRLRCFTVLMALGLLPNPGMAQDSLETCSCLSSLTVRPKDTRISLTWTGDGGASYSIWRSTAGAQSGFARLGAAGSGSTSYIDNNVELNRTYYYRVENAAGCLSPVLSIVSRGRVANRAPVYTSMAATEAAEGVPYLYDAEASDPDGHALTYYLDQGPAGMTLDPGNGRLSWIPPRGRSGSACVSLRVSDGTWSAVQAYAITVASAKPPTIAAAVAPPANAAGWHADDAEVAFTCLAGTEPVSFCSDPITVTAEGIRTVRGVVRDVLGFEDSIAVTVRLDKTAPRAAIASPGNGQVLNTNAPYFGVSLREEGSGIAPESIHITLNQAEVTGKFTLTADTAYYQVPAVEFLPEGENRLVVGISDRAGNSHADSIAFQVRTGELEALPEAVPDSGDAPLTVRLVSKGKSPYRTINWYRWDFTSDGTWDDQTQVARDFTHTYTNPGTYRAALEVEDMDGRKDTGYVDIVVTGIPPTAHASAAPSNGAAPLTVAFTGTGSAPSGYIKYHRWDFQNDGVDDTVLRVNPDTAEVAYFDFESGAQGWFGAGASGAFGRNETPFNPALTASSPFSDYGGGYRYYYGYDYITSPDIDLSGAPDARLDFWSQVSGSGSGSYSSDFYVYVVDQNGSWWYLADFPNPSEGNRSLDLSAFAGQRINVVYYYYYYAYGIGVGNVHWQLDDVAVRTSSGALLFSEDFSTPSGWVAAIGGIWEYRQRGLLSTGIGNGWMEPNPREHAYGNGMDANVTSPPIALPSDGTLWMAFRQYLATADNGDGGIVEISADGGPFSVLAPLGGYPGRITGHGDGFTGSLGTSDPVFDLAAYAGKSVRVRFQFWSDGTGTARGWLVDSVRFFRIDPPTPGMEGGVSTFTHIYPEPGSHQARFTVVDNVGRTAAAKLLSTALRVGGAGTPSVASSASSESGMAPLGVQFQAVGSDADGQVVLYEWDFDGDGAFDWSSTGNGSAAHTYRRGGTFIATVRVTDNDGLTSTESREISVGVNAGISIAEYDQTFNPYNGQSIAIATSISGDVPVRIYLKDRAGTGVRTLVDWQERAGGSYQDLWDGRDGQGNLVPSGNYYAVLQYRLGAEVRTVDLTLTTGGNQYNPQRDIDYNGYTIDPYANLHQAITFHLDKPADVTLFMGLLWGADMRLRTLLNRVPHGAGAHTVHFDGLTDDGRIPYEHSGDVIPGLWGYDSPQNGIWVQGNAPVVTSFSTDPTYFAPMSEACGPSGERSGLHLTYSLSGNAARVAMKVYSVETGQQLLEQAWTGVSAGSHTVFWNGRDAQNRALDRGGYRLALSATDAQGNTSPWRYNLMKTLYSYQKQEEP